MPSAPPSTRAARAARRRRIARRRRFVAIVVAIVIIAALVVGVFGFIRSLSDRAAAAEQTGASAGTNSGATGATGASAGDSSPAAPAVDVAGAADDALAVLADYSDAARGTEDALYIATERLRAATTEADQAAALAETQQAVAAVKADAEAHRAGLATASAGTNTQPTGGDVAAQLGYLHQYVFSYNTAEWGDYNPYGGDCTNFASQGLIARGWHTDDTWYSDGAMWTASKPWIATAAMAAYFDDLGLTFSTEADLDRVRVGDVGLFTWGETGAGMDHTMTVSKVEYVPGGAPIVSFISHNDDGEYRELTNALYVEHQNSTVRIYHIP